MTKDEYLKQLEECQKAYDAYWKTYYSDGTEDFYPGQSTDCTQKELWTYANETENAVRKYWRDPALNTITNRC